MGVRGTPWVHDILGGIDVAKCEVCLRELRVLDVNSPLRVALDPTRGSFWPDVLGCGACPLLLLSDDAVSAWQRHRLGELPLGRIEIVGEVPKKMREEKQKAYYWVDGSQMRGARVDFDKAGFVEVEFCKACGTRSDNVGKTYDRQHAGSAVYSFLDFIRSDLELFTTDISPTLFFCKEAVVACAREHKLTNFRFVPLDWGVSYNGKGLDYMAGASKPRSPNKALH